jgi:hypothetical protein
MDLPEDATIASVADELNKPVEFVRRVVDHMWNCRRKHGSASVRIGVMGQGRAPNYRIEYGAPTDPTVYAAYNGLSHKEIEDLGQINLFVTLGLAEGANPDRILRQEHWSTMVMSLEETSALLGRLRQRKR